MNSKEILRNSHRYTSTPGSLLDLSGSRPDLPGESSCSLLTLLETYQSSLLGNDPKVSQNGLKMISRNPTIPPSTSPIWPQFLGIKLTHNVFFVFSAPPPPPRNKTKNTKTSRGMFIPRNWGQIGDVLGVFGGS